MPDEVTTTAGFTGLWKPATAGERLVHFLANNVTDLQTMDLRAMSILAGVTRGPNFGHFLQGCLVLHCFGRLLQVSKHFRTTHLDDASAALLSIETFAIDRLSISRGTCKNFEQLSMLSLEAAEKSAKASATPNNREKFKVRELCHGVYRCYSCDRELSATASREDASFLSYDHVWPHSFGGDSIEVNLLPSCQDCNTAKQHTISWEWGLVQSILPQTELGEAELHSLRLSRASKIALHMRAAMDYARMHGTTLKDGFLSVGPRLADRIIVADPDDTPDFFNLRVHDTTRTDVLWEA